MKVDGGEGGRAGDSVESERGRSPEAYEGVYDTDRGQKLFRGSFTNARL